MEKITLTKIQSEEVEALNNAKEALNNAKEALNNAKEALKNSSGKKPSEVGKLYIASCEAEEVYNNAYIAYTEKEAKTTIITFPKSDSKEEWNKRGLTEEYNTIALWYKATDSIMEAFNATLNTKNKLNKQDILDYMQAYTHQITNCNDLIRLGYISENSDIVIKNKSNFAFASKEARQSTEAVIAKNNAIVHFQEILEYLLNSFIEEE